MSVLLFGCNIIPSLIVTAVKINVNVSGGSNAMLLSATLNVMKFSLSNGLKVISWFNVWPPGKSMRENKIVGKLKLTYTKIFLLYGDTHAET